MKNKIMSTLILTLISTGVTFADSNTEKIMYTNDLHANTSVISTIQDSKNTLWIDGGDLLHGTDLALMTQGEAVVDLANNAGLDILVPGNHDFDYGWKRLKELETKFEGDIAASNVYYSGTKDRVFKPYVEETVNGKKILIIGLTTEEINTRIYKPMVEGITVTNPIEEYNKVVSGLDLESYYKVILVAHVGDKVISKGNFKGADVILDGHDHIYKYKGEYINNGFNGESYTLINVENMGISAQKFTTKSVKTALEIISKHNKSIPKQPKDTKIMKLKERKNLDKIAEELNIDWRILYQLNKDKGLSQKYQFVGESIKIPK